MKLQEMKKGFLGSDEGVNFQSPYKQAKCVIIPFGYEGTVSYGNGTKNGPKAIITASYQVETLDEQTLTKPYKNGIATLEEPKIPRDAKQAVHMLSDIVSQSYEDHKFPIILGGEHSITQGCLIAACKYFKDITILHFDAHPDMREHYHGSEFSHASVFYQSMAKLPISKIVQVGIRNLSDSNNELEFRKKFSKKIKTFWGWDKYSATDVLKEIKTKNVFISFDVDAFDPGIIPSTGTPEPGGLLWWPTLEILETVFKNKNVIGADVLELAPIKNLNHPDFTIAKLVHKMIAYKFK